MKIAIHERSGSFSDRWLEFVKIHNIPHKLVDCYSSDIVEQMKDCDGLMWHWAHNDYKAEIFARQLTLSLESIGKTVFPNSNTCWHYNDKIGQKYLLESIGAPLARSYVFYDMKTALTWAKETIYPKVFKLRRGASSENVKLVKNHKTAQKFIKQSFSKGFKIKDRVQFLKERLWHFKRDKTIISLLNISKGLARLFIPKEVEKKFPKERHYSYFQDFVDGNKYDIRVVVIGDRAIAFKRIVREGDFRASGSGKIIHDSREIPVNCIKEAFKISEKLKTQCLAYDFLLKHKKPCLIEMSYGFLSSAINECSGFWDKSLSWKSGEVVCEDFMIEDFLRTINAKKQ